MKLSALVQDLSDARILGPDLEVGRVRDDSRAVEPGDVFVAVRGLRTDGHAYVPKALERGARALVLEERLDPAPAGVTQVLVARTAEALGALAARQVARPADKLALVGITGTNGKTTTTYLVEAILQAAGARPGIIGTVNYRYAGQVEPAPYTTPTPLVLHEAFAKFVAAGCTHAMLEVSSVALDTQRMAGVRFQVAGFSNLSQDHLDMHGTMDAYRQAKELLFSAHLADDGVAVINIDDSASSHMIAAAGDRRVLRVSCDAARASEAEICVLEARSTVAGIRARIQTPTGMVEVSSDALLGHYNIANLAMAVGLTEALGVPHEAMTSGIAAMRGVPGRVERVANDQGLDILVDYAHTPDALINVSSALRPLARRRLICVFGCGGDRDPTKRPIMGAAVAEHADLAVVTSDNPRTEDARSIIDMILPAVPDPFYVDVDRRTAIRAAVAEAVPGDIVLIAGKGHEDYQILGTEKIHFDDREEAAAAVAQRWRFPLVDVVSACAGTIVHRPRGASADDDQAAYFTRVHYDGRIAAPGDLYVAVRGERLDGHAFSGQAVAAGARGVVIEAGADLPRDPDGAPVDAYVIAVEPGHDSGGMPLDGGRMALGAIARWHRRRWGLERGPTEDPPVIALTGSAGKTTTKELLASALSCEYRVHATRGSLNNETGVPFTLLGLQRYHDAAVIEMGMRGLGQIDYLAGLTEPTVSVVVNAGEAHVGVVGTTDDIARGKAEVFGRLGPGGVAVVPADDTRLLHLAEQAAERITFGMADDADVRLLSYRPAGEHGADVVFAIAGRQYPARIPIPGQHNARNAACAVAAAMAAGISAERAVGMLERTRPAHMRSEVIEIAGRHVLLDCYNANPASMAAALDTLRELAGSAASGNALAVVGDMLELGATADAAHREVGRRAHELDIKLVALGEFRAQVIAGAGGRGDMVDDVRAAADAALGNTRPGDWILIKASRGMSLERVAQHMRDTWPGKEA